MHIHSDHSMDDIKYVLFLLICAFTIWFSFKVCHFQKVMDNPAPGTSQGSQSQSQSNKPPKTYKLKNANMEVIAITPGATITTPLTVKMKFQLRNGTSKIVCKYSSRPVCYYSSMESFAALKYNTDTMKKSRELVSTQLGCLSLPRGLPNG